MAVSVKRRISCLQMQDIFERAPKNRFTRQRKKALHKGKSWNLSLEEYSAMVILPCTFCGEVKFETGVGLDRLDNSKGYTVGNVQPACRACNLLRGLFPIDLFFEQVSKVYKKRGKRKCKSLKK